MKTKQKKASYGIDAPYLGLVLFIVVVILILSGTVLSFSSSPGLNVLRSIILSLTPTGVIILLLAFIYMKSEKFRHRDWMIHMLDLKGNEHILDIGTGRGLLMIAAAKKLSGGKSIGIDIWNNRVLENNNIEATIVNAELEVVRDMLKTVSADARSLPFTDEYFDCVISNLCIHNIRSLEGRRKACSEIVRILKPQGIALISDFKITAEYSEEFRRLGLRVEERFSHLFAPLLLKIVKAVKE